VPRRRLGDSWIAEPSITCGTPANESSNTSDILRSEECLAQFDQCRLGFAQQHIVDASLQIIVGAIRYIGTVSDDHSSKGLRSVRHCPRDFPHSRQTHF
jgi:hypothetical protein